MTVAFLVFFVLAALSHAAVVALEYGLVRQRYEFLSHGETEGSGGSGRRAWIGRDTFRVAAGLRLARVLLVLLLGVSGLGLWQAVVAAVDLGAGWAVFLGVLLFFLAGLLLFLVVERWPARAARTHPARAIAWSAPLAGLLLLLLRPVERLSGGRRHPSLASWMGREDSERVHPLDLEVQLRALQVELRPLPPGLRRIVDKTLQLPDLEVSDVLLPRSQVVWLDLDDDAAESLTRARQAGHTRYPLCEGDLDHCVGILHIKDVFRSGRNGGSADLRRMQRPIATVRLEDRLADTLSLLLRRKVHMALVLDEFGGAVGVITLERILEELVGEIQDEFDREPEEIIVLGGDRYSVAGLTPIHDLEERLGQELHCDEVSTFSGLITAELGRIPERGETLTYGFLRIAVREVDERRVIRAEVERIAAAEEEEGTGSGPTREG
jgi:CBS domain containing-hemolysin-like protein